MATSTIEAFYVGNFADLDTDESDFLVENEGSLAGFVVGGPSDPLYSRIEDLTMNDTNNDGIVLENDQGQVAEGLTYQGVTADLDAVFTYDVTITFNDGSTATTNMGVLQDVTGRVFLIPRDAGNPANDVLNDRGIESIRLDTPVDENYMGVFTDKEPDAFVVCFTKDVEIETPDGPRLVSDLQVGDIVLTLDEGPRPLRWVGQSRVASGARSAPVQIATGALDPERALPSLPLLVSPQHRVLIRSKIVARMFGVPEVLVPAIRLVGLPGITRGSQGGVVDYYHLMLDAHQILWANGAQMESFLTGPQTRKMLRFANAEDVDDLKRHFPMRFFNLIPMEPARPIVQGRKARNLIERHHQNAKPLQCDAPAPHSLSRRDAVQVTRSL